MMEVGRQTGLGNTERFCPFCRPSREVVEDEEHMIFDCAIYSSLRLYSSGLFADIQPRSVAAFLAQENQAALGRYLQDCEKRRNEAMEAME